MLTIARLLLSLTVIKVTSEAAYGQESPARKIQVLSETATGEDSFRFPSIPLPAVNDAGASATWTIAVGDLDRNSSAVNSIHDGVVPDRDDQPQRNVFFAAATTGGVLVADLGKKTTVSEIVSYSWHSGSRAPQVYMVYGATGDEPEFSLERMALQELQETIWTKIASIDTRQLGSGGGQHAARIFADEAGLGDFRYLVFQVQNTDVRDPFSNTFFSEIDVLTAGSSPPERLKVPERKIIEFSSTDQQFQFSIDVTNALELEQWTTDILKPVILEWYPKIVEMLPSDGFKAPAVVRFRYLPDAEMKGIPAYASGGTISMNAEWFRGQLEGEARGAVVHEMVHVVQGYPARSRRSRGLMAPPGWIVEGIPDYVRWFLYEPETGGALMRPDIRRKAKHDASYRTSANFIDWVIRTHTADAEFLKQLNAAAREGRYSSETWKELTGLTEAELAEGWRKE